MRQNAQYLRFHQRTSLTENCAMQSNCNTIKCMHTIKKADAKVRGAGRVSGQGGQTFV